MANFTTHPDFPKAVKLTMLDILDGKEGMNNLTYPFEFDTPQNTYPDAVEVIDHIHKNGFLLNFTTPLGSGLISKHQFKAVELSALGKIFLNSVR